MINKSILIRLLISGFLIAALAGLAVTKVKAAGNMQQGVVSPTPESADAAPNLPGVSFAQMGQQAPLLLQGPADSVSIPFNLVWGQQPEGAAKLELQISAYFSSLVAAESSAATSGLVAGDFSAALNGTPLGVMTLQTSGDQTLSFDFDSSLLKPAGGNDTNELTLSWDGSASCRMNLLSSITILPTSTLQFNSIQMDRKAAFEDFPAPFYIANSISPASVTLVVPDDPTPGEMRAALIVAAGFGQLTSGKVEIQTLSWPESKTSLSEGQSIILVATSTHTPDLKLSAAPTAAAGQGIIALFTVNAATALLVSGDEEGIVKAAQALSLGQINSGGADTLIVSAVNPPVSTAGNQDMTLNDLGIGELVFSQTSGMEHPIDFYLPAHKQTSPEATFDLVLSHSQQIDYLSSGLQISINGVPVSSLRLNDNTSNQTLFKLILPASLTHPGRNTLRLSANMTTRDLCSAPTEAIAWLRVSSDSLLHLPLEDAVPSGVSAVFADFPARFMTGSGLADTTIALPSGNFAALQSGIVLAYDLGAGLPSNEMIQLQVVQPGGEIPATGNLILIGSPADFPVLALEGYFPALKFAADGTLDPQSGLAVVAQEQPASPSAWLAIRSSGGANDRMLLVVLGSGEPLVKAANSLTSTKIKGENIAQVYSKGQASGGFEVIIAKGSQVQTGAVTAVTPPSSDQPQQFRWDMIKWVVPLIALLLLILVVFLLGEFRARKK